MYKIVYFSVFLIVDNHLFEISTSKIYDPTDSTSVSEVLLTITYFQKKNWRKWLFFVLEVIKGAEYLIRSFRVYPMKNQNLESLLVNQYFLIINIRTKTAHLKIDVKEQENFISKINNLPKDYSLAHKITYSSPIPEETIQKSIRVLDLDVIRKEVILTAPKLLDIQMAIMNWSDLESHPEIDMEDYEFTYPITALISREKITSLEKKRNLVLEQPLGQICLKCGTEFSPNLHARTCTACLGRLVSR